MIALPPYAYYTTGLQVADHSLEAELGQIGEVKMVLPGPLSTARGIETLFQGA